MKIAILYGTKYGTTEKIAELISKLIIKNHNKDDNGSIDVELINLKEKDDVNLDCDILIIGSSVYMGRIRKEVKSFIKKYRNTLIEKRFALFICGANEVEGIKQINKVFPSEIVNHSIATAFLEGELNLDKMKFLDRKIAQFIIKGANKEFKIDDVAIDEFVQKIKFSI
ncbi:MAG: flavodoxin domain-containing protein [Methanobacteriaceae archaeon]|jgi:menaquinone-dependent protoporphyrinogen oxidase|nr:flavodoxin domain-containing protein [Candidatus Methanorudis spinitermitis]